jgi:nucleotide-binding universal stress UspA family protein
MKILAATDFSTRAQRALRRAGRLARDGGAELVLLHVVDDDQPQHLVELEKREAAALLAERIEAMEELQTLRCRAVVEAGSPFDGILRAAAAEAADLIVMGAHRRQLLRDIFIGTTIERVIRSGPRPVLMVNRDPGADYATVLAPVDLSEMSARAIDRAREIGLLDRALVTVLHAFYSLGKGRMVSAGIDREAIERYVDGDRRKALEELASFMATSGLAGRGWTSRAEEGGAFEVIQRIVEATRPDLLVLGTHGRSAFVKVLIGSVTEEALRSLDADILAVPPTRPAQQVEAGGGTTGLT